MTAHKTANPRANEFTDLTLFLLEVRKVLDSYYDPRPGCAFEPQKEEARPDQYREGPANVAKFILTALSQIGQHIFAMLNTPLILIFWCHLSLKALTTRSHIAEKNKTAPFRPFGFESPHINLLSSPLAGRRPGIRNCVQSCRQLCCVSVLLVLQKTGGPNGLRSLPNI